jgi:hypothetical protein
MVLLEPQEEQAQLDLPALLVLAAVKVLRVPQAVSEQQALQSKVKQVLLVLSEQPEHKVILALQV